MTAKPERQDLAEPATDTTALRRLEVAAATQPEDQETFWVRWNPYPGAGGRTWAYALDALKSAGTRSEESRYSHKFVCVSRDDDSGIFAQILGDPIQGFIVEIGGGRLDDTYAATHQSGDGELIELQSLYRWCHPIQYRLPNFGNSIRPYSSPSHGSSTATSPPQRCSLL